MSALRPEDSAPALDLSRFGGLPELRGDHYPYVSNILAVIKYQLTPDDLATLRYWEPDVTVPRKLYLLAEIEALVRIKNKVLVNDE